jgi:hypothetical protein
MNLEDVADWLAGLSMRLEDELDTGPIEVWVVYPSYDENVAVRIRVYSPELGVGCSVMIPKSVFNAKVHPDEVVFMSVLAQLESEIASKEES